MEIQVNTTKEKFKKYKSLPDYSLFEYNGNRYMKIPLDTTIIATNEDVLEYMDLDLDDYILTVGMEDDDAVKYISAVKKIVVEA